MSSTRVDVSSAIGKAPRAELHVPLIVIGGGKAGLAAAEAAAQAGVRTMLIDEHPLDSGLIALDVPLHFGQRANTAAHNKQRMTERIVAADPDLARIFELGVDVQLGVCVWGAFINNVSVHSLRTPLLGLADGSRSWMVSFDRLIVAAGARDLAIGFRGWEKPGVMGAHGALTLLERYQAMDGRRLLILGSGALGLLTAATAIRSGREIAGIVEVEAATRGPKDLRAELADRGVPFFLRHVVREVRGVAEVDGAVLVAVGRDGKAVDGGELDVNCDTVVFAMGSVPNVELLETLGCAIAFRPELGGRVPIVDGNGQTSIPCIYAVGDCAGCFDEKLLDVNISIVEARRAAIAAARSLGANGAEPTPRLLAGDSRRELPSAWDYWQLWSEAEIAASGTDVHACQCEEVSRAEIMQLRPPRYLNWHSAQMDRRDLAQLAGDGPLHQDQVKRLTRAGMGPCQGRRCREQVQMLIASATAVPASEVSFASYRPPVRPLPLSVLAAGEESEELRQNWVAWFNIPSQWTPHWEPHSPQQSTTADK